MNLNKIINNLRYIGGLPKSIYVNLRVLPIKQAIKLPIIVSSKTQLRSLSGKIELAKVKTGVIRIGFGSIQLVDYSCDRTILNIDGKIVFKGKAKIGMGSKIEVASSGILEFGENFINSATTKIICHKHITIGKDCLFGWDSLVMDTDYHTVCDFQNKKLNEDKAIVIGNKVWIGAKSSILKGSNIPYGSVIAFNTVLYSQFYDKNVILGGNPVRVIKKNIMWYE